MKRIELHIETSYSYKNLGSKITPKELLEKVKKENIKALGIVDYCNCASILEFEKLKKELNLDVKIIYGIYANIKYADLDITSVILAKNTKGLKNLYSLVTLLNEHERFFLLEEDIKEYRDNLLMGMSECDLKKDYGMVINNYDYVEVNPLMNKDRVIEIEKYAKEHELLVIATSTPAKFNPEDKLLNIDEPYLGNNLHFYSDKEMLEKFNYLKNKEEIIFNNPLKIVNLIENYELENTEKFFIQTKDYDLKEEVYERANLIYLDNIPKKVQDRINYEIELIRKYDLEGTIEFLDYLINMTKNVGVIATIGSSFSHSLIAYLLGMIPINPMEHDDKINFLNNFQEYGFRFEIFLPERKLEVILVHMINKLRNLYQKGEIREDKIVKTYGSYYLVPKECNPVKLSPIDKFDDYIKTLVFENHLSKNFVSLRFRPTLTCDRVDELSYITKVSLEDIKLDNKKVLHEMYKKVSSNKPSDYKTKFHYNVINMYGNRLLLETQKDYNTLYELIDSQEDKDFLSRVLYGYYDAFYRIYYPKLYYEIYLDDITEHFKTKDLLGKVPTLKEIEEETDAGRWLTMQILYEIHEKGIEYGSKNN